MHSIDRQILRIALPSIITNITVPLLGLIDLTIAGHLGDAMFIGAMSVGAMMFNLTYWNFGFLRMGTSGITHDKNMITDLFSDENSGLCNEFLAEMAGVINDFFDKKVPFTQCENDKKAECKYCRFIEFCRR